MEEKSNLKDNQLYQKAIQAFRKNNFAYAVELFNMVLTEHPDFSECRHYLLLSSRENQKANQVSALKLILNKIKILFLKIKSFFFSLQNPQEAIKLHEQIVLLDPFNTKSLYSLASLFNKNNKLENALVVLEEIVLIDKNNLPALKSLADLYFKNKQYKKAKNIALMILKISPKDFQAENIINDIAALGLIEKGFDQIKPAN